MRLAQSIDESVRSGEFSTFAAAALVRGHTRDQAEWYRRLLRLPTSVQQRILAGEASGRSISELRRIAALPTPESRNEAFEQLLTQPAFRPDLPTPVLSQQTAPGTLEQLRCAVYFNPEAFAAPTDARASDGRIDQPPLGGSQPTARTSAQSHHSSRDPSAP